MKHQDVRPALLRMLNDEFGVPFVPVDDSLDVLVAHGWDRGNCRDPVFLRLACKWTAKWVEEESLGFLAVSILEHMETDTITTLEELWLGPNWLRRPALRAKRR